MKVATMADQRAYLWMARRWVWKMVDLKVVRKVD
jgi:hypothetical protein